MLCYIISLALTLNWSIWSGGSGGKGTWGGLLETGDDYAVDPHDPNYDSSEVTN